jgi:DNA topoisomerase-1
MEQTYIRVGNSGYEKMYGSYGLTTLKSRHVTISRGAELRLFCFTGKKGVVHRITLRDKRLARIIRQCREIPGKELFQYYDENGERRPIDSGKVNSYLRELSGSDFTAKDFRTWAGTLHALECFCKCPDATDEQEARKQVVAVLDAVSKKLGNSRAICRKYYVHPGLVELYETGKLKSLLPAQGRRNGKGLEQILLKVLRKCL